MHILKPVLRLCLVWAAFALFAIFKPASGVAQPASLNYFGLGGAININQHSLERQVYRGSELCGVFTDGSGLKPSFHFLYETKPAGWGLWLSPRLVFNNLGGDLTTAATDSGRIRNPIDSSLISSQREHRIDAAIPVIGLELFAKYKFDKTFFAFGGPTVSFLLSPSGEQQEVITQPSTGFFDETGTSTRVTRANAIEDASAIHAAIGIGIGADIPVAFRWTVTPEISAHIPLTKIVANDNWRVTQYRFGLTVKLDNSPKPIPSLQPIGNQIAGSIELLGLERNADGTVREVETPTIRVEEFVSREALPVLNSVFFETNSATIPSRYSRTSTLDSNVFRGRDALAAHHRLLEIVGSRMRSNPQATLTLNGIQTSDEAIQATLLAQSRAQAVADYLVSNWAIDRARINITVETRPSPADEQLREETQKVDLVPSDLAILDPFIVQDITRTMNPPGVRVKTDLASNDPIRSSNVTIGQKGGFNVNLGDQQPVYDWFSNENSGFPTTEMPLVATLSASTGKASFEAHDSAQVQQITIRKKRAERIADLEIERYNLITFEFDKASLDARADRIMMTISSEATSRDNIEIAGYTDLLGDQAHNDRLASDRATSVATALRNELQSKAPGAQIASRGEGESDLYDNRLPEGRQLSRTVRITIKRPIGE
jgi:outer membrane protein OmpA-like peptidoglycan-associated protein